MKALTLAGGLSVWYRNAKQLPRVPCAVTAVYFSVIVLVLFAVDRTQLLHTVTHDFMSVVFSVLMVFILTSGSRVAGEAADMAEAGRDAATAASVEHVAGLMFIEFVLAIIGWVLDNFFCPTLQALPMVRRPVPKCIGQSVCLALPAGVFTCMRLGVHAAEPAVPATTCRRLARRHGAGLLRHRGHLDDPPCAVQRANRAHQLDAVRLEVVPPCQCVGRQVSVRHKTAIRECIFPCLSLSLLPPSATHGRLQCVLRGSALEHVVQARKLLYCQVVWMGALQLVHVPLHKLRRLPRVLRATQQVHQCVRVVGALKWGTSHKPASAQTPPTATQAQTHRHRHRQTDTHLANGVNQQFLGVVKLAHANFGGRKAIQKHH